MKKKLLLTFILITISIIAFGAITASAASSGTCGANLTWTLDDEGTLTITGEGEMSDSYSYSSAPWYNFRSDIMDVVIEDGVTSICNYAFYDCNSLTNITIGDGVTSIGDGAFYDCSSLISITIGDGVTSIGDGAFYDCNSLTSVSITDITAWCNIDFYATLLGLSNPLYYADNLYLNGELVTNLILPDDINEIKDYTFWNCSSLTNITIPDSVTSIGACAFSDCSSLININIPDSVTSIGEYAFYDCSSLISIDIPNSVTSIGNYAFSGCGSLINITIPDSVTSIGNYAFSGCGNLISIDIPDSVTSIGRSAFSGCSSLISIDIPDSVTSIGEYAFYNCSSLISITLPTGITSIRDYTFKDCNRLTSIVIPDGVTSIGNSAFFDCNSLTSIAIPDSVTSIGDYAFRICISIASVNITDISAWCNIDFYDYNSNPLYEGADLYLNGELVTSLILSDDVKEIKNYAFYNCDTLTDITIPNSVSSIGNSAFYDCNNLTTVTIPSSITTIPESAFQNCSNIKGVILPEELMYIRNDAFNGCTSIDTVFYAGDEKQWDSILKYSRNENLTNANIVFNAEKKTYKFDTNCDATLPSVTDYAVFTAPTVENEGMILCGWYDNEDLSGSAVTFPYYGDATTLYASWTDRTGLSFDDAIIAKENNNYTVTTTESGQIIYYEFVPKYTGEYRFYSEGSLNTYGYLYNSSKNQIAYNNNDGDDSNFYIAYDVTAGETYYIGAKVYSGAGTFTLVIETDCVPGTKTVCVSTADGNKMFITLPSYLPEDAPVILACYKGTVLTEVSSSPNKNETIYFVAHKDFDSAKVMVWESFDNIMPLCEVEIVG